MKKLAIAGLLAAALSLAPLCQQTARAGGGFNFNVGLSVSGSWYCNPCGGNSCQSGFGYSPEACGYSGYGYGGYYAAAPYAAPQAAPSAAPTAAPQAAPAVTTTGVQNAAYYYGAPGYGYGYNYGYYPAPSYWYGH